MSKWPRTFIPAVGTAPYTAGNGVYCLNFHRNRSVRITTAVCCYGTTIVLHLFYIHFWTDGIRPPFPAVFRRFIAVYAPFCWTWEVGIFDILMVLCNKQSNHEYNKWHNKKNKLISKASQYILFDGLPVFLIPFDGDLSFVADLKHKLQMKKCNR